MAIHRTPRKIKGTLIEAKDWTITHIPSRLAVCGEFRTRKQAIRLCNIVSEAVRWEDDKDTLIEHYRGKKKELLYAIIEAVKEDKSDGDIAALIFDSYE